MDLERGASKRPRSPSPSYGSSSSSGSSPSPSRSRSLSPPPKFHRAGLSSQPHAHECNLPPTCSPPHPSTSFATPDELERHQAAFHRWVCHVPIRDRGRDAAGHPAPTDIPTVFVGRGGFRECAKVFPEERLLNLASRHHTEVHDPLALERKAQGAKIFACFLPRDQCDRRFLDPSKRRRHLIDKHGYPPTYFFSITNHGINRIAREDGLAMSLVRPRRATLSTVAVATGPDMIAQQQNPGDQSSLVKRSGGCAASALNDTGAISTAEAEGVEEDMQHLSAQVATLQSSLSFVPRTVRKKGD